MHLYKFKNTTGPQDRKPPHLLKRIQKYFWTLRLAQSGGSRDEGKKEKYDLDIDIARVAEEERTRVKNGQGGYCGHRTMNVPSDTGHVYQVFLRTPSEMIFEGSVCFSLLRKQGFEASTEFTATLDAKLIRSED